jgi:hypothetical protein
MISVALTIRWDLLRLAYLFDRGDDLGSTLQRLARSGRIPREAALQLRAHAEVIAAEAKAAVDILEACANRGA